MCLVKSLFGIKIMNKLESVNTPLLVRLLFMMYNDVKIEAMLLKIQIFNVEKKHDEAHNTKNKAENELQINSNL